VGEYVATTTPESSATAGIIIVLGIFGLMAGGWICLAVLANDALVAPVAVLEDLGPRMAGKRARALMKKAPIHGSGTQAIWTLYPLILFIVCVLYFGILACLAIAGSEGFLTNITSGLPFQPLLLGAFDLLPAFLTIWTVIPVWATTVTMLYFDRRIRLEGFDIEILGRDLARTSHTSRFEL
jgi:hypothetical protein